MTNSVRAWVLLTVTLCLGIAIGLLSAGALQDRRMARVNDMRRPGGLTAHVRSVIRPTSEAQWDSIRPLVEATAEQTIGMRRVHDSAMRAAIDTLKVRLEPLLTAEQQERFSRFVPGRADGPPGRRGRGREGRDGRDGPPREGRPGPPQP